MIHFTDSNYMRKTEDEAIDSNEKFGWNQTKLNLMFYAEKNGQRFIIDSFQEYITLKAQQVTFDVAKRVYIFEDTPYGPCNLEEIEEKMSSSKSFSEDFL